MEKFYSLAKRLSTKITVASALFFTGATALAQTTLAAGDLIFTAYDSSPLAGVGDKFSFVLLTPIQPGTVISFTDRGYSSAGWQVTGGTESSISWVSGTALPAGTEVYIVGLVASTYNPATLTSAVNGTVTLTEGTSSNGLSLSNAGDQIIAFQGGGGSVSAAGANCIAGINYFYTSGTTSAAWNADASPGPNASIMPPGLNGGFSAFYTGSVSGFTLAVSGKFGCTGVPASSTAAVRTALMNTANWTLSTSPLGLYAGCNFLAAAPVITANPANKTACSGTSATFTVSATNASSYQWYQNTGAGFVALTNTAVFSGTTTATLTVSGITAALNSTQYRCLLSSAAGTATSNAASLTVTTVTATGVKTDVLCNGSSTGAINLTPAGGTAPYTFNWGNNITTEDRNNLPAGTYSVTVTDNTGCTGTASFIISQPATAVSGTTVITNVTCNGSSTGAINLTPAGGTAPYTFNWGSGITTEDRVSLAAGNYAVTITDANGCTALVNATVTQPTSLAATVNQTDVSCNGGNNGTASLTVSGGTAPYTYAWLPTGANGSVITGLASGTYSVTIKDANLCSIIKTVTITQPAAVSAPTGMTTQTFTAGATISSLIVTGQNIKWYMTAVDAALHVNPISASTSVIVNNTTYYATQTVNGCESTASLPVLAFNASLATTDISSSVSDLQVYPNPVQEVLNISGTEKIASIVIYAADGRKVLEKTDMKSDRSVSVSSIPAGVYMLQIKTGNNIKTVKIIRK